MLGYFVAIAFDTSSIDTVWFIQIVESNFVGDGVLCDDYSHKIAAGVNFLKGHFLEKEKELSTTQFFKHSSEMTCFYLESILYPYVNLLESKKGFILKTPTSQTSFIMKRTIISVINFILSLLFVNFLPQLFFSSCFFQNHMLSCFFHFNYHMFFISWIQKCQLS